MKIVQWRGLFDILTKSRSVFGLDIGYETIKLVQLTKSREGLSLVGAVEMKLKGRILEKDLFRNETESANQIREAMRLAKPSPITAKHLVSSLPETFVFTKTIQLPKMSERELASAVPNEAIEFLPIPLEDVYLDYQILITHPDEPLIDIFVAAAPKKLVDGYVKLAKLAGLELVALETKSFAAGRALTAEGKSLQGTLILHIGTEFSRISIWDANTIRLSSTVSVGKNQIIESLGIFKKAEKEEITITPQKFADISQTASPIIDEIIAAIKYHQTRDYRPSPISKIILCGSSAALVGLDAFIEKEVKIKTEKVELLVSKSQVLPPQYIAAFGLALRNLYE